MAFSQSVDLNISGQGFNKSKTKDFINQTIIPAVCALRNSSGGTISITGISLDVKSIEQGIINLVGPTTCAESVKVIQMECSSLTSVEVKKGQEFTTVSYNLYLPTQKQIVAVKMTDRIREIQNVLNRNFVEDPVLKDSHVRNFVLGSASGIDETDEVQLKSLKSETSSDGRPTNFASRMLNVKNKFSNYVSGFANHRGGYIYYGINDNGVVTGERLKEEDLKEINEQVRKAMEKIYWTKDSISPQQGVNWEIYFEKVKDARGEILDCTYVVAVFVNFCRGGVFTAKPESYYIDEKEVN